MNVWFLFEECYFFPHEQNSFAKNQLMVYSSEKRHGPSPRMKSILAESHFFKQAYQKNYCSSLKTRYLIGKNVSFWVSSWEFLSFTQESIFVFKLIVLHIRLTLLVRKNHIPKYSCWWSLCAPLRSEYNLIRKLCIRFPKTTHRSNNPIVRKSIGHNCFQSIPYYICIHRNPHKFHFQNSLIHRNKSEQYCS